jgi:hypothetical protein
MFQVIKDHALDQQIVSFFNLSSVMDIALVEDQGYRYMITLEDGTKRVATKAGLAEHAAASQWSEDAVYQVVSRFNRTKGVCILELRDTETYALRKVVERNVSTIIKPGMRVNYRNFKTTVAA